MASNTLPETGTPTDVKGSDVDAVAIDDGAISVTGFIKYQTPINTTTVPPAAKMIMVAVVISPTFTGSSTTVQFTKQITPVDDEDKVILDE